VVRELGRLEDCGGTEGLNRVYGFDPLSSITDPEAARAFKERQDRIYAHYLGMLKAYALARANEPPVAVYRFNRGDLTLVKNKTKTTDRHPEWTGEGKVAGRSYHASAWRVHDKNGQSVLSISLCPK